jgi:hypothetical protein
MIITISSIFTVSIVAAGMKNSRNNGEDEGPIHNTNYPIRINT